MSPPSSTIVAVTSRIPPSSSSAPGRVNGPAPSRWNASLSASRNSSSVSESIAWRWIVRASVPRAGSSLIQLRVISGSEATASTYASTAWRTCRRHGSDWSTASSIRRSIRWFVTRSRAT